MKKCYKCKSLKDGQEFYKDIRSKDGLSSKCKECAKTFRSKEFRTKINKKCNRCSTVLPVTSFDLSNVGDGYQTACKTCRNLVKTISNYDNINWEWYHRTVREQQGKCKICRESIRLQIDHCHETGKVRGLLCGPCNRGLGHFQDNPERLTAAAEYLIQSKTEPGLRDGIASLMPVENKVALGATTGLAINLRAIVGLSEGL